MMVIPADLTWVFSIFQLNVFLKDVKFIFTRIFFLVEGLFFLKILYFWSVNDQLFQNFVSMLTFLNVYLLNLFSD